jgi:hypothetical protein
MLQEEQRPRPERRQVPHVVASRKLSDDVLRKCAAAAREPRERVTARAKIPPGGRAMKQSRRVSPRAPYDEAVCLTRVDGAGRLFGRSIDLGPAGIYVTCAELCEIGTELVCTVLLPGGPRRLRGRVVRLVALPRAVGIAIAFGELREADRLAIERLVASRTGAAQPAKLRVDGLDHDLRCEAVVDGAGARTMRVSTALPEFLRLDARVNVDVGTSDTEAGRARGVISRIAVDPVASDGVPRLALDVDIGTAPHGLVGRAPPPDEDLAPPSGLPRPYRHPLPSVVLSRGLERDLANPAPPPRLRRKGGTAELPNRLDDPLVAPRVRELTQRLWALRAPGARTTSLAWMALPIALIAAELLLLARLAQ